jgi:hypothetical protein
MLESLTPQAVDPYGIAKYAVEMDLHEAREMFGLDFVIFRPHNVYGERQNIGDRYRNVIGIFMNQILGQPMTISAMESKPCHAYHGWFWAARASSARYGARCSMEPTCRNRESSGGGRRQSMEATEHCASGSQKEVAHYPITIRCSDFGDLVQNVRLKRSNPNGCMARWWVERQACSLALKCSGTSPASGGSRLVLA